LETPRPTTAFIGTLFVGTERLERPLTESEKKELSARLREHDYVHASLVSLRFALKLTHRLPAAQDLRGRARLRLVRQGWDPRVVTLVKCLCRFVWSEHTHAARENETTREVMEAFLREQSVHHVDAPSAEDRVAGALAEQEEEARAKQQLDSLRAAFVAAGDEINLLWLDYRLAGVSEPREMARLSGRDISEFYRATDRRKRHTERLLAAQGGATFQEST
jgi:hypothetical protein